MPFRDLVILRKLPKGKQKIGIKAKEYQDSETEDFRTKPMKLLRSLELFCKILELKNRLLKTKRLYAVGPFNSELIQKTSCFRIRKDSGVYLISI